MSEEIKVGDRVRCSTSYHPAIVLWLDKKDVLVEFEETHGRQVWPRAYTGLFPRTVTFEVTLLLEEAQALNLHWPSAIYLSPPLNKIRQSLRDAFKEVGAE